MEATKFGNKTCVIGDTHLNKIKRNIFQKSVNGGGTHFNAFRSATSKRRITISHQRFTKINLMLFCYISVLNNQTKDKINTEKLTGDIINIGKPCIDLGVKEVVISILPKKNIALTRLIRQVNDSSKGTVRIEWIWFYL